MFYVAYFQQGRRSAARGRSSSCSTAAPARRRCGCTWAPSGPRVVTADDTHTPAAPYRLVDNVYSLLDASDLVFIDAPGTGFGRIAGKDKEKAFYGVDPDAYAFAAFIMQFLSKYGRWNSPKYLFGESYGTPRSAVLVNELETEDDIDFNGVIMLSQILNFDLRRRPARTAIRASICPTSTGAADLCGDRLVPQQAAGPAARRPRRLPAAGRAFRDERLRASRCRSAAASTEGPRGHRRTGCSQYTGLPVAYILKANLRIDGGEFEKIAAGFSRPDHRPSRHALFRPHAWTR